MIRSIPLCFRCLFIASSPSTAPMALYPCLVDLRHKAPQIGVVLGTRMVSVPLCVTSSGSSPAAPRSRQGEIYAKGRARPRLAVDVDKPAVLLHNAVHGGQTEPGALAHFLRAEERIEDLLLRRLIHSRSGVGDDHHRVCTGLTVTVSMDEPFVHVGLGCSDKEPSSPRHGVTRVGDKIEKYLIDLGGIGHDDHSSG